MNAKMSAFKCIVHSYKCNCLLNKENIENSYFPNDKTCHYAENYLDNLDNVPKLQCEIEKQF